jgi:Undecaprenyl-phosphate glucose phosphotransferase
MFVDQVDHFLEAASAPPLPESSGGPHISPVSPDIVAQLIPLLGAALVFVAALLVHLTDELFGVGHDQAISATLGIASIAVAVAYGIFRQAKLLKQSKPDAGAIDGRAAARAIALVALVVSSLLILLGIVERYSLYFMALWLCTSSVLIFGAATLYERLFARKTAIAQRVAIFGEGKSALEIAHLLRYSETNYVVKIFWDSSVADATAPPCGIDELVECARSGGCDRIIIAMAPNDQERIRSVMARLEASATEVQLCAGCVSGPFKIHGAVSQGPMLLVNLQQRPLGASGIIIKGMMDYVLATIAIVALAPLMILIALAIKLDSRGPVFFVQARTGHRGIINVIKFRSMKVLENGPVIVQAQRDDPRITRVGRFLRRTSLDELPQLFNVLRGELSLVGPRPHAVAHDKLYGALIKEYANRRRVKPGITGFAQVSGFRSETCNPEMMHLRVKHDLYYIDHWSAWFDISILFRTIGVVFWDRHAY